MNYEEMKEASKASDHQERILKEIEQPLKDALANTLPDASVLEIGNRDGGSAVISVYHIALEGKGRKLVTVDAGNPNPQLLNDWVTRTGIKHDYHKSSQEDFVKGNVASYGFIFLDSDHDETRVVRDMRLLAPNLVQKGIMAVDDVHGWKAVPDLRDVGLEQVDYGMADIDPPHRNHICYWKKA